MKRFSRQLAALLIAALMLAPVAMAEGILPEGIMPEGAVFEGQEAPIRAEAVDEAAGEQSVDLTDAAELGAQDDAPDMLECQLIGEDDAANLMAAAGGVEVNEANFPDPAFRDYVAKFIDRPDADGVKDGVLSQEEIEDVRNITLYTYTPGENSGSGTVAGMGIKSLEGIRYFTQLTSLSCEYNELTALDVSGLANLTKIDCYFNQLQSLNVTGCINLEELMCSNNQIAALDVSSCAGLVSLHCNYNALTALDARGLANLKSIWCYNTPLTAVSVDGCMNLWELRCDHTELTALNVADMPSLYQLVFDNNPQLKAVNLSGCPVLDRIFCYDSAVTTLNARGCPNLKYLYCDNSQLTHIDIGDAVEVKEIDLKNVPLKSLIANKKSEKLKLYGTQGLIKPLGSSNTKVALIGASGYVFMKKAGKAKITYKENNKKRSFTLTVVDRDATVPWSVSIAPVETAVKKGGSVTLTPVIPDGTYSAFTWKSSNKKVATVKGGVVRFKKKGKVTITCTAKRGKKKASVTFRVSN